MSVDEATNRHSFTFCSFKTPKLEAYYTYLVGSLGSRMGFKLPVLPIVAELRMRKDRLKPEAYQKSLIEDS